MSSQHAIGLHQRSRAYLLGTLTLPHHVNRAVLFGLDEGSSNLVRRSLPMMSPVLVWVVYPAPWSIGAQYVSDRNWWAYLDGRQNRLRDVARGSVILDTATLAGSSSLFEWTQ